jgi:hypothetical protein
MAKHAHPSLTERLEKVEESPFLKRMGLVGALILAPVIALALAHYVGLY